MAPIARELAGIKGILEPLQTATTLQGQVQELKEVLEDEGTEPVILVGFSWGAMLSLVLAASYPPLVKRLILISSAVYEDRYAMAIAKTRRKRLRQVEKEELDNLILDSTVGMARLERLLYQADAYDPLSYRREIIEYQPEVFRSVWGEATAMRRSGELLKLIQKVICPVYAIHGDYDPHPFAGVKEPLEYTLKNFRFTLLKNCGHRPWVERQARDHFYSIMKSEIELG